MSIVTASLLDSFKLRFRPTPEYGCYVKPYGEPAAGDFECVVIAHGDLIERDAKAIVRAAWARPLKAVSADG